MTASPRWGRTFPLASWFNVEEVESGVYAISEPGHVNSFVIEGSDRSLLLDTGLGIANIRQTVEGITSRPLMVVNTHHHFDHTGGNFLFPEISIHSSGVELLRRPVGDDLPRSYMGYTEALLKAWDVYKLSDDRFFHLITKARLIRPLPLEFDPHQYRILPTRDIKSLAEGDRIDLGGRSLTVLYTPGHSPDTICLLDEANGLLFGGDTINTGPIYAHLPGSDLVQFARSTARLADTGLAYRRVLVCHFMRYDNEPSLVHEIASGFDRVLNGQFDARENQDCLNEPVREVCFDNFSIFVPPEVAGEKAV